MLDGSSDRYAKISGPTSLEQLGCDFGYGWYRLRMPAVTARKVMAPQSGDRLHVYHDAKFTALLGLGPGAQIDPASVKLGDDTVILADNLGRFCFGWQFGEAKGLLGHLYDVAPLPMGKARIIDDPAPDPFSLSQFWVNMRADEPRPNRSVAWQFNVTGARPVILETRDVPAAVVVVNGQPVALVGSQMDGGNFHRLVLHVGEHLKRGRNGLRLALMHTQDKPEAITKGVKLYQATQTLTDKAEWAFAPWTVPAADRFRPAPKATPARPAGMQFRQSLF
jgi:hypothetical protein